MTTTVEAVFDGMVFRPIHAIGLEPNTYVKMNIETAKPAKSLSFLQTARMLDLDGPSDWAARLEDYLYGDKDDEKNIIS
ncbi:hypothetical protein U14_02025 [Candidatus Moduliflexus flocculans]|uniref:DUF104 domain-containing protein n=1 Tax=Candidatus Moduliflexus flocculans TaxID=1499966 RepID=A0A0S6VTK8_9BACT|nr:hypothetical protein U14_02025 [Candidatus Moduliflexus flocculans]